MLLSHSITPPLLELEELDDELLELELELLVEELLELEVLLELELLVEELLELEVLVKELPGPDESPQS